MVRRWINMTAKIFKIGIFIPLVLFLAFLTDTLGRFASIDRICNSGIEAVFRFRPPDAPFEANKKFERADCMGDLIFCPLHEAALTLRKEKFCTDDFGYRITPKEMQTDLPIIFAGSSLIVGVGVSDNQTIPAKLGSLLGGNIYNAGQSYWQRNDRPVILPLFHIDPERIVDIAKRLNIQKGLVILEMPEEARFPYFYDSEISSVFNKSKLALSDFLLAQNLGKEEGYLEGFLRASPLRRLARKEQGKILQALDIPNPLEEKVALKKLKDGKPFLFNWRSVNYWGKYREEDRIRTFAFIKNFRAVLSAKGLSLAVVFLPSKYSVYAECLSDYDPSAYKESPTYLEQLEKDLKAQNIKTLNLTTKLQDKAKEELQNHNYLFYPDDTHLTEQGIDFVSGEIALWLKAGKTGS